MHVAKSQALGSFMPLSLAVAIKPVESLILKEYKYLGTCQLL